MALQGGHRFSVQMDEVFPRGLYAMSVEQAQDFNEVTKARTPSVDKQTGSPVWNVTCIDLDPEARSKEIRIKLLYPHAPDLPGELLEGSGLRPIVFHGLTITPYVDDGGRGRPRMAFSIRADDYSEPGQPPRRGGRELTRDQALASAQRPAGKAPAGSATETGRSAGQAPAA